MMQSARSTRKLSLPLLVLGLILCLAAGSMLLSTVPALSGFLPRTAPATVPPAAGFFPPRDTPYADAPKSLQAAWRPYQVTIIPSRHIFDGIPTPEAIRNMTNGALSDTEARRWAWADLRDSALLTWADANRQIAFRARFQAPATLGGPIATALGVGAAVTEDPCAVYARTIALYPIDDATRAFFASHPDQGDPQSDRYVAVETYTGPCQATARYPDGHTEVVASVPAGTDVAFHPARLVADPVLGDFLYADAVGDCGQDGAPPQLCSGR